MAEGEGFEPPGLAAPAVFKSVTAAPISYTYGPGGIPLSGPSVLVPV